MKITGAGIRLRRRPPYTWITGACPYRFDTFLDRSAAASYHWGEAGFTNKRYSYTKPFAFLSQILSITNEESRAA
jgi:hypothetical protein